MNRHLSLLVLLSPLLAAAEPEVRVSGVQVVWDDDREAFDGFGLFSTQDALALGLVVDAGGPSIIEFDEDASELVALRDDLGTKLGGEIGPFPKISEDGRLLRLELKSEKAPAAGASQLQAKGEAVVITGSETETLECGPLKVEKDAELDFGHELEFRIAKVGKPDWGDAKMQIDLEIKRDIPEVATLRFYDAEGGEIESDRAGTSRMSFNNNVTVTHSFTLAQELDEVRFELDRWTDLGRIAVPFEFSIGLGGAVDE